MPKHERTRIGRRELLKTSAALLGGAVLGARAKAAPEPPFQSVTTRLHTKNNGRQVPLIARITVARPNNAPKNSVYSSVGPVHGSMPSCSVWAPAAIARPDMANSIRHNKP